MSLYQNILTSCFDMHRLIEYVFRSVVLPPDWPTSCVAQITQSANMLTDCIS